MSIVLDWYKSRYAWLAEFLFIISFLPPSGFIVASPGHPIASAWLARIKAHWSKSYAERPDLEYLWVNKLFRQLVGTEAEGGDLQARAIWDKVPKISCEHGKKGPMRFLQLVLSNICFRFAWSHHDKGADNVDKRPVSKLITHNYSIFGMFMIPRGTCKRSAIFFGFPSVVWVAQAVWQIVCDFRFLLRSRGVISWRSAFWTHVGTSHIGAHRGGLTAQPQLFSRWAWNMWSSV